MHRITFFLLIILISSCWQKTDQIQEDVAVKDNEELKEIYQGDQADRQTPNINWKVINARDSARKQRVYELLDSNLVRTSNDYANAAMIFQHGADTIASGMAVKLMRRAVELDSTRSKWLLAAAIDRDLMRKNKPQIYGTQYTKSAADVPWELYLIDSTQVTDEERKDYGVETLAEQREKVKKLNAKKLFDLVNKGSNIDDIIKLVQESDLQNSEYDLSESGINSFGYQLMRTDRDEDALAIFKMNTELYPEGFNTFDSYGECLVKTGRIEEGLAAYKKSLELNPDNSNARQIIEKH